MVATGISLACCWQLLRSEPLVGRRGGLHGGTKQLLVLAWGLRGVV